MSDPIRSISQNNFILADQKEVSHDNTLSGNGTPESPLGVAGNAWIDVTSEVNYNTNLINSGGFVILYNKALKMVNLVSDVNVKAGSVSTSIMTWTDRLKPYTTFALGQNIYVSTSGLTQSAGASSRWINGSWCWAVRGE